MKVIAIFVTIICAANAATDEELWKDFKLTYSKQYSSGDEKSRFTQFQVNLRAIENHNAKYKQGNESYFLKITEFTDLSDEEFRDSYLSFGIPDAVEPNYFHINVTDVPDRIDWRDRGAVLRVKHQGKCLSSWAFSTTGALEGQNVLKHNISLPLSEQYLIDCSDDNEGCDGGEMEATFHYLERHQISMETGYPYTASNGLCVSGINSGVTVDDVKIFPPGEDKLQAAVGTYGPVSVALNANLIKLYGGGIFNNAHCDDDLSYTGLAVGYGSRGGIDYWTIKLSLGDKFGENGYLYLIRNQQRQCGIGLVNLIPVLV